MPEAILSAKDKLKKAKPQRRGFRMNLRGDVVVQIEQLESELDDARQREIEKRETGGKERLYPETRESTALAQRIKDLEAEMEDGWLDFVLEARPWSEWRDFKLANPPQENDEQDKAVDFHFSALVESDLLKSCVVEPELDAEDWETIFRVCSPADIRNLGLQAFIMHERVLDIPKSLRASALLAQSDAVSRQQHASESASEGSTDGSPSNGTSTSTSKETESEPPEPTSP